MSRSCVCRTHPQYCIQGHIRNALLKSFPCPKYIQQRLLWGCRLYHFNGLTERHRGNRQHCTTNTAMDFECVFAHTSRYCTRDKGQEVTSSKGIYTGNTLPTQRWGGLQDRAPSDLLPGQSWVFYVLFFSFTWQAPNSISHCQHL